MFTEGNEDVFQVYDDEHNAKADEYFPIVGVEYCASLLRRTWSPWTHSLHWSPSLGMASLDRGRSW